MKTFNFTHNDYVQVTLTKEGAEFLSKQRKDFYDMYPKLDRYKEKFVEGEIYKAQFWSLVNDFHPMMHLGSMSPFQTGLLNVF